MECHDILSTDTTVEGLCKVARELGYVDPCSQLINKDGTCVGDLLYMLEDCPGACEALLDWMAGAFGTEDDDEGCVDEDDEE